MSRNANSRLRTLFKIRQQISGEPSKGYLSLAKRLIGDADNDCRWQALIVVGEFIHTKPLEVWKVAVKYGRSEDDDMRSAVATVLLEHLLEHQFRILFPKVKREASRSPLFADTLSRCSAFGKAKHNWRKVGQVLEQLKR